MLRFVFHIAFFAAALPLSAQPLLESIPATASGIDFRNDIGESTCRNVLQSDYLYNGGGVAIGDLDNDGLPDLYFTGNFVPNRLYWNRGQLQFEDGTEKAGVAGPPGWTTGVTLADVNADGWLDIYVCQTRGFGEGSPHNLLYVNQGDGSFKEQARQYGIADTSNSAHATFFDYDLDGDLDLYVVNYKSHPTGGYPEPCDNSPAQLDERGDVGDHLYRNEDNGTFSDVTRAAGITDFAFGLSATVGDLNSDGWPDIYVANDYDERDLLYFNNGNGTFSESIDKATKHISRFSMGSDIADFNNDNLPDILVVDMVSAEYKKSRTNMGAMRPKAFWQMVNSGEHYQYMSNCLQLNNGNGTFREIGQFAGIAKTDWSWGALFADLDNDGWKDILITNGIRREIRDNDLPKRLDAFLKDKQARGEAITNMELLDLIPVDKTRSYAFRNDHNYGFEDKSEAWGFSHIGWSNGMAYGDLDNDGDLDLVVNNLEARASLYKNTSIERKTGNFIRFRPRNTDDYAAWQGTKVTIETERGLQRREVTLSRGFYSSVDPVLHFGLGNETQIARAIVTWPGCVPDTLRQLKANRTIKLKRSGKKAGKPRFNQPRKLFNAVETGIRHVENEWDDTGFAVLLPRQLSREGPKIEVGDLNGDGRSDVILPGPSGSPTRIYLQTPEGEFSHASDIATDNPEEEAVLAKIVQLRNSAFVYLGMGGNELRWDGTYYRDHLYQGNPEYQLRRELFKLESGAFPTGCVAAGDFDGDGDEDLFVGGLQRVGKYPWSSGSQLLINDGGMLYDKTRERAAALQKLGLTNAAAWVDLDDDGDEDLIVAGEWEPIRIFENRNNHLLPFQPKEIEGLQKSNGLWYSLTPGDFDHDGDIDFLAGNLGLNSKYKASPSAPLHLFAPDKDGNGYPEIILAQEKEGKTLPVRGRECTSEQYPSIKGDFPTYAAFADADLHGIFGSLLDSAVHKEVYTLANCWVENLGNMEFKLHELPAAAQFAPIKDAVIADWTGDGQMDVIAVGNDWATEVETIRHDAGAGMLMTMENGKWNIAAPQESGLYATENAKSVKILQIGNRPCILIGNNDGLLQCFCR